MAISFILLSLLLVTLSSSYPTGAPEETCKLFTANHQGHQASTTRHNYQLTVSPATISPGATVTVTLQGLGGETLKGFFIQGQESSTKSPVGKFQRQSNAQTRDCSGPGSSNSITHINSDSKDKVILKWTAPSTFQGTVVFRAVVVKTYEEFWNNIYSNQVTIA